MYFADTTINEGCPIFRALCERWEPKNSTADGLDRACFWTRRHSVIPSGENRPLADDLTESRDPASAGTRQEIEGSSLQELCSERVRGGNPSRKQEQTPATSGSFDCGNELARESVPPFKMTI
jgi:hypothetical protein